MFSNISGATIGELMTLSKGPILVKKMGFGKYRGMDIKEMAADDPGYVRWLLNKADSVDEDLRHTLQLALTGAL